MIRYKGTPKINCFKREQKKRANGLSSFYSQHTAKIGKETTTSIKTFMKKDFCFYLLTKQNSNTYTKADKDQAFKPSTKRFETISSLYARFSSYELKIAPTPIDNQLQTLEEKERREALCGGSSLALKRM